MCLIGLDVGTTGCKATLFSEDGRLIAQSYREYPLYHPRPSWSEEEPGDVWRGVVEAIKEVIVKTGVQAEEVKALSVSAQGEAFMPLDRELNPLYRCITTWDDRAVKQHDDLLRLIDRVELFKITGHPSSPVYTLFKLIWFKQSKPDIYEKTWKFLLWEDYINMILCGVPAIDYSLASRTMLFDIRRLNWSHEILELSGLDIDKLPEPYPSSMVVGEVSQEASRETGLARGTLVVTGGHDQACGTLGVGAVNPGATYVATGTVESIVAPLHAPLLQREIIPMGFASYCHVVSNRYLILGANPSAGILLRWFRDKFGEKYLEESSKKGVSVYDLMMEDASKTPPGSQGLLIAPYFMGAGTPNWDTYARGLIIGLTVAHGRPEIIRAIVEGITYELRLNIETLEKFNVKIEEIRTVGGGARSSFWLQLKADVTGKRVVVPEITEASSAGAAMLAGLGARIYGSVNEAVSKFYRESKTYQPNLKNKEVYDRLYSIYVKLCPTVKNIYKEVFQILEELSGQP
jgi:xylulokinase